MWSIPNKGTFITEFSARDIMEIYQVRECLEGLAASVAAVQKQQKDIQLLVQELERL